jgi:sugar lactone lactonase YvrE
MRRAAVVVLLLGIALSLVAAKSDRSTTYTIPGNAVFPEGIGFDGRKSFYVSSTSDGTIFKGTIGKRSLKPFLPAGADGRTTAVGVEATHGRVYIAGGATGLIWMYDARTGALLQRYETGSGGFLNDVAVDRDGDVFVTDSQRPFLFVIAGPNIDVGNGQSSPLEPYMTLDASAGYDAAGFKWNGIEVTPNGKTAIAVHSSRGELYRVDIDRKRARKIDTGGADLTNGDGLVLNGDKLYVVRNQNERIVEMRLNRSLTRARQKRSFTDKTFMYPTTAALAKGRLLVVNSQFDRRGGQPDLPFTVSSVKRP